MAARKKYPEGTVFSVPLRDGGFARGVVARVNVKLACVFGYFFGPKLPEPILGDLDQLKPNLAIAKLVCGDLGIINGEWELLGPLPGWERDEWGMPDFVRRDPICKRAWRVRYSDIDPTLIVEEEPVSFDTDLQNNWSWGYGAVELELTDLLS